MESRDGAIEENLRRATEFVDQAAASGARLILLPEFMPTGYQYTNAIWDAGEPADGPTVSWLKESSDGRTRGSLGCGLAPPGPRPFASLRVTALTSAPRRRTTRAGA